MVSRERSSGKGNQMALDADQGSRQVSRQVDGGPPKGKDFATGDVIARTKMVQGYAQVFRRSPPSPSDRLTEVAAVAWATVVFSIWTERAVPFMPTHLVEASKIAVEEAVCFRHVNILVDIIAEAYDHYYARDSDSGNV